MARPRLTEQRRLQALQAAVEVIAERGLCDTRISDIAARAGSSPALLLYYFDSKEKLLTDALTYAEDRFYLTTFHDLDAIADPAQRLTALIENACPPDRSSPSYVDGDWALWIELWSRAVRDEGAARKRQALDRRWRTTISDIVREGQRSGAFAQVDPDDFAVRLAAMMDGFAIQVMVGDADVDAARMKQLCLEAAATELGFALDRPPARAET